MPTLQYQQMLAECRAQHPEESADESHARVIYRHVGLTRSNRFHRTGMTILRGLGVLAILAIVLSVASLAHGQNVNIDRVGGTSVSSPLPVSVVSGGSASDTTTAGSISTAGVDCSVATRCVIGLTPASSAVSVQVSGSWTGTLQFEERIDASNWVAAYMVPIAPQAGSVTSTAANGTWTIPSGGIASLRVRASTLSSGTVSVTIVGAVGSYAVALADPKISGPDAHAASQTQGPVEQGGRYYTDSTTRTFATDANGVLQINQTGGSVTINTTSPLSGGGTVAFGGTLTLQCPTCVTTSLSNPMTNLGDIIYGAAGGTPTRLAIGGATTLLHGGTTPAYSAVVQGDVTNGYLDLSSGQTAAGAKIFTGAFTVSLLNHVVYGTGYGMVCDGSTDDTSALQTALTAAGQNGIVILPPGTCENTTNIQAYDGSTIMGCGKFCTTIQRKTGANSATDVFIIAAGGGGGSVGNVTFRDFAIDGNQANQTTASNLIQGATVSKTTIIGMRFLNSYNHAIRLGGTSAAQNASDVLIADNDFENNGLRAGCVGVAICDDIRINSPLRVRVTRNRSNGAQNFFESAPQQATDGYIEALNNIVDSCLGFAIALGGAQTNASVIANTFNCPTSTQNIIDIATASNTVITGNNLTMGTAANGIADAPPATKVTATGNTIVGNTSGPGTASCISLGGSHLTITGNVCYNAGGAGIIVAVGNANQGQGVTINGNVAFDNSRNTVGAHAGIELFLQTGGTAALNTAQITGNIAYDDQATKTQAYGIGVAFIGQTTGYSNVTIFDNDVRGNKYGGIINSATATSGFNIYNNPGGEFLATKQVMSAPSTTNGSINLPALMSTPSIAPTITCSNSGGSLAAATHFFKYVFNNGAANFTLPSSEVSCATTGASGSVVVTAPQLPPNATGYTVYDSNSTSTEIQQAASANCVNITGTCTVTVLAAGGAIPGSTTASAGPTTFGTNKGDLGITSSDGTVTNDLLQYYDGVAETFAFVNKAQTWTADQTMNTTATGLKVPVGAGLAPTANGNIGYDSTANKYVGGINGTKNNFVSDNIANTAGASMTIDMSAAAGATGLKTPVAAGAAPTANGAIALDSTALQYVGGIGGTKFPFASQGVVKGGVLNLMVTAANFVTAANTNLQTITGLSFTFPANQALNANVDCDLNYSQQTAAVADAFGFQDATIAPTNLGASGFVQTAITTWVDSTLTASATTTATNIVAMTPSAITTVWHAKLHIGVEQPSNASTSLFSVMAKTGTAADTLTIFRGSGCLVHFQ